MLRKVKKFVILARPPLLERNHDMKGNRIEYIQLETMEPRCWKRTKKRKWVWSKVHAVWAHLIAFSSLVLIF